MLFVILVDDDYCVAIHDLSPVLTALFSIELGGFNRLLLYNNLLLLIIAIIYYLHFKLFFSLS